MKKTARSLTGNELTKAEKIQEILSLLREEANSEGSILQRQQSDVYWTNSQNVEGIAQSFGLHTQGMNSVKGGYSCYIFL